MQRLRLGAQHGRVGGLTGTLRSVGLEMDPKAGSGTYNFDIGTKPETKDKGPLGLTDREFRLSAPANGSFFISKKQFLLPVQTSKGRL